MDEQRTEQQRLEEARRRIVERTQARDTVGMREAEAAITRHEPNLKALATELGPAQRAAQTGFGSSPAASPLTQAQSRKTVASNAQVTPAAPNAQPARWWDVYDRTTPASATAAPTNAAAPLAPPASSAVPPQAAAGAAPSRATSDTFKPVQPFEPFEPFQPTARRLP